MLSIAASRSISSPIVRLVGEMNRLAGGNLETEVSGTERNDEVGEMSRAVLIFRDAAIRKQITETEVQAAKRLADEERSRHEAQRSQSIEEQTRVVEEIGRGLSALAGGDLTHRIVAEFPGLYRELRDNFNDASDRLQETVLTVAHQAAAIAATAGEISSAAATLADSTEHQAGTLEQAGVTISAVSSQVTNAARAAAEVADLVSAISTAAASSDEIVNQAVEGMGHIRESSRKMAAIISVIDDIAVQTNLLALNAGVEAARAGPAGRGFAVVAMEVRALAQKSAKAAKEIDSHILTSSGQVERGSELVASAGELLRTIAAKIQDVEAVVSGIAHSASDQAVSIGNFRETIQKIDRFTQQTATMAEQSSSACHAFEEESSLLASRIGAFKVGESIRQPPETVARRA